MQDRYAGDVGDFGKYGLLRSICSRQEGELAFSLGVNWYLVPDGGNAGDGRFTEYPRLEICDPDLYRLLRDVASPNDCNNNLSSQIEGERQSCPNSNCIGKSNNAKCLDRRCVYKVECRGVLPAVSMFYNRRLCFPPNSTIPERREIRSAWVKAGCEEVSACDIVFFDPDNGLQVKSVGKYSQSKNKCGIKYVFADEVVECYRRGQSLIIYQHCTRENEEMYLERIRDSIAIITNQVDTKAFRLRYRRGTARDFIVIPNHVHPWHRELIEAKVDVMLNTAWNNHFEKYYI